jgi:DNA-binding response OmpR family regulator
MSLLAMKERPSEVIQRETYQRFQRTLVVTAAGEPADFVPTDKDQDRLLRVLIVDDHRATANTLSALVGIWGHEVRRAYDGVTGLALAAAFRPDVLLLDILMPDMSGFEVATQVRRQSRLKNCFMIAVTGRTDETHRCQCYEAGVDLCLVKPIVPSTMQMLLTLELQHIRSRRQEAHAAQLNGLRVGYPDGFSPIATIVQ